VTLPRLHVQVCLMLSNTSTHACSRLHQSQVHIHPSCGSGLLPTPSTALQQLHPETHSSTGPAGLMTTSCNTHFTTTHTPSRQEPRQRLPWYKRQPHLQGCACQQAARQYTGHLQAYTRTSSATSSARLAAVPHSPGPRLPGAGLWRECFQSSWLFRGGCALLPVLRCLASAACAAYQGAWGLLPASPWPASPPAGPSRCDSRPCVLVTALPPACANGELCTMTASVLCVYLTGPDGIGPHFPVQQGITTPESCPAH
jgi:hypothetical protein